MIAARPLAAKDQASANIRWSGKGYRFAVYLDLENLTREYWECEEWDGAIRALGFLLDDYSARGAVLVRVAACNGRLAELLRPLIDDHNIETLIHSGGENAADNLLIRHLENHWPQECNVVVIGSGDSRFISVATRLKEDGKRLEGISPTGGTATDLYRLLDQHHQVPTPGDQAEPNTTSGSRTSASDWSRFRRTLQP